MNRDNSVGLVLFNQFNNCSCLWLGARVLTFIFIFALPALCRKIAVNIYTIGIGSLASNQPVRIYSRNDSHLAIYFVEIFIIVKRGKLKHQFTAEWFAAMEPPKDDCHRFPFADFE